MSKFLLVFLMAVTVGAILGNEVSSRKPASASHKEYFPESKFGSQPLKLTKEEVLKKHPELKEKEEPQTSEECVDEDYVPKKEEKK